MTLFKGLSIRQKLYGIVALMAADLAVVLAAGAFGMWVLSDLRAYVGGEGLWAKSQKDAIVALERYARSRDEADYREFEARLAIPHGDRRARLALSRPQPDLDAADAGFIAGGNHPDDVRGVSLLFLYFHRVSYIGKAIALWAQGDELMADLERLAGELHARVSSGRAAPRDVAALVRSVDALNLRLTRIETDFSYTLGEASRWAKRTLFEVMALGAALLGLASLWVALSVSRDVSAGIGAVARAAARAERGDLGARVAWDADDEIGRLAQAFNHMAEGLSKLDRLKSDFIATVSHELRTPLTLALAPLESLLAGECGGLDGERRRMAEMARANALRLLQMVNGLLDFSKLEAGRMEAVRGPLEAVSLTRAVVDDFRPLAARKGVRLDFESGAPRATVLLDRYLYERIVFNLVSNALKFTPAGGAVLVRLGAAGGRLGLAVADTGIGIAEADRAHLFERFRQLESSAARRYEGTGLGLALVKEFAALLGGTAAVESAPGRGSTFRVDLAAPPCAEAEEAERSRAALPEPAADEPAAPEDPALPLVLLAEDNDELARYLARLLKGQCRLRRAADGERLLELARAEPPALVVSDVMMPGLDGLAACRALKADPATARVPVVLLTALTDREAMLRGWEAGADEYLFKPFHPDEVRTRVRTLLAGARERREAAEALERKSAELARSNAELEQFAFVASHDLQEPLRKVVSFCQLLEQRCRGRLDGESAEFLRHAVDASLRMQQMIRDLLTLSRASRNGQPHAPVDSAAALARALANLETERVHSRAEVAHGALPVVEANAPQLEQLFQNLVGNALKFRGDRPPAVRVEALPEGGMWRFSVRDEGIGLEMRYAERIFEVFERLHPRQRYPGNGIGLAVCKRIVERHGGRIWVESEPGRGATFYFTLPRA